MNLFKKALVATAIVASFGASATATVSSTPKQLSAEGVADGLTADNQSLVFDVVVGVDTPASSTITLTFDNTIDLAGVLDGTVANAPGTGLGQVGVANAADSIQFNYGTGSFTFDDVVVTDNDQTKGEQDTLSFKVNLGNALTAGSAFRISLGHTDGTSAGHTDIDGAANLAYQSVAADGTTVIENGTGVVAEETAQFAFAVDTPYSELIDRDDLANFTGGDDTETATFHYTNNEDLAASLSAPALTFVVEGNFLGLLTTADFAVASAAVGTATAPATPLVAAGNGALLAAVNSGGDSDELTVSIAAVNASVDGTTAIDVVFDGVTVTDIPVTGALFADASIVATNGSTDPITIATNVAAGEWKIDATIINVPYLPVGYEGTSTSVHFANEGAVDVDVIVTAIDDDGNTYGPLDLGMDFAADTVTKVGQATLMSLFSLTESTKLSVTFNLDANDGVVNAYAFTQSDAGRTEISNSQLKGRINP